MSTGGPVTSHAPGRHSANREIQGPASPAVCRWPKAKKTYRDSRRMNADPIGMGESDGRSSLHFAAPESGCIGLGAVEDRSTLLMENMKRHRLFLLLLLGLALVPRTALPQDNPPQGNVPPPGNIEYALN